MWPAPGSGEREGRGTRGRFPQRGDHLEGTSCARAGQQVPQAGDTQALVGVAGLGKEILTLRAGWWLVRVILPLTQGQVLNLQYGAGGERSWLGDRLRTYNPQS